MFNEQQMCDTIISKDTGQKMWFASKKNDDKCLAKIS
jgi:hypothetical protein